VRRRTRVFRKRFGDVEAQILLEPGIHVTTGYLDEDQSIKEAVFVGKGQKPLSLESISTIAISEMLHDMEALASAAANPRSSKR
jgi:hypothetical protein